MTTISHYVMVAAPGQGEALRSALEALIGAVRLMPGSAGVELLGDCADESRYIFIERWTSEDARRTAGASLPKDVMTSVMAALATPPNSMSLKTLSAGSQA